MHNQERSRLKSFTASYIFHINDFKIFKNINIKFYKTSCSTQLHLHQSKHSNSQGCVTALFDWFDDKMLLFVGTVSTVLVFQVIFTFLLACFSLACPICPGISPVHSPQFKYSIFISWYYFKLYHYRLFLDQVRAWLNLWFCKNNL